MWHLTTRCSLQCKFCFSQKEIHEINALEILNYVDKFQKLKVQKVYKGDDLKLKELTFCEHFVASDTEMKALFLNDYPLVKGEKYLFFLKKANTEEEKYFAIPTQGVYSLDSDKNTSNLEKQVKEMFKDEFKDK